MNIPNIPTDNLYKFLSISGLLIIILSIGSLFYNSNNLNTEILVLNRNISHYNLRSEQNVCDALALMDIMEEDLIKLGKKEPSRYDSIRNGIYPPDLLPLLPDSSFCLTKYSILALEYHQHETIDPHAKIIYNLQRKYWLETRRLDSLRIECEHDQKQIKYKERLLIYNIIVSVIGILFGLICSFIGFSRWYYKHQQYSDIKIRREVGK